METTQPSNREKDGFMSLWTDLSSDLWQETYKHFDFPIAALPIAHIPWPDTEKYKENKTCQFVETAFDNIATAMNLFIPPHHPAAYLDNMISVAEVSTQMALDSFENMVEFQTEWLKRVSRIGEQTQAYRFDDIDPGIFNSFRRLYHQEIQKYLFIPQLGLPRDFHENVNRFMDKMILFFSHLMELIYLFGAAFDKSGRVIQGHLGTMMVEGEIIENPEQGYEQWIKTLEGHLMILLKSEEFLTVLDQTIASFADYKKSRDDLFGHIIKALPIPSNRDMDAVYKELYDMRKRINQITETIMGDP